MTAQHVINFTNCTMSDSQSVFSEVKKAIEANGSMDPTQRDKLLLMAITCVFVELSEMKAKSKFLNETILKAVIGVIVTLIIGFLWAKFVTGS